MDLVALKEKIELLSKLILDMKIIAEDQSIVNIKKNRTFHYEKRGPNRVLELLFKTYNVNYFEEDSFEIAKKLNVTPDVVIKNLRRLATANFVNLKEEHKQSNNNRLTLSGYVTDCGLSYIIENNICPI